MKESKEIKAEEALNDEEMDTVAGGADNVEATFELPELGKDLSQKTIRSGHCQSPVGKDPSQRPRVEPSAPIHHYIYFAKDPS